MLLCIILGVTGSGMKALSTTLEYSWKELETRNPGVYHSYIAKFSLVLFQLCSFSKSGTVLRQGPGSYSKKICITKSLSSTALGPPTQVEDGNVRLNIRFLNHQPVLSPPVNQKKTMHLAALSLTFTLKTLPWKHQAVWVLNSTSHPYSLLGPAINLSLLQTLDVFVYLSSLCVGTRTWVWQQMPFLSLYDHRAIPQVEA